MPMTPADTTSDEDAIPAYPALVGAAHRYRDADGAYRVGYARSWLRLRCKGTDLEQLFELLDGTRSIDRLLAETRARLPRLGDIQVLRVLTMLARQGLLMDGGAITTSTDISDSDLERHSRDLEFYALFERPGLTRTQYLARVRAARIAIVGMGGIASWLALALAGLGVGTVIGIDDDVVEASNLGRQALYTPAMIGQRKVEAAADFFTSFAPETRYVARAARVTGVDDVAPLVQDADLVIVTADWPPRRVARWLNAACWSLAIPSIYVSADAMHINVGPLVDPRLEDCACYECFTLLRREKEPGFAALDASVTPDAFAADPTPALSPIPGLAGQILAWEALCSITGLAVPQTRGHVLRLDLETFVARAYPIPHRADCPVCRAQQELRRAAASTATNGEVPPTGGDADGR